jgi:hypothetical protein
MYPGIGHEITEESWNDVKTILVVNSYGSPDIPIILQETSLMNPAILQLLLD